MTNEQAKNMLKAKLECLKRETSGTDFDCNNSNCDECSLCYEQGNMGEQKEALDMAIKALEQQPCEDTISRQAEIDAAFSLCEDCDSGYCGSCRVNYPGEKDVIKVIRNLPSAEPERKKMSNKEWVDFLSEQFTVSRTSAREMLHGLMRWKAEDNFKKQFSGGRNESRRR